MLSDQSSYPNRRSPITIQIVAQLISFPIGRAWARWVPNVKVFGIPLNPGPFNVKEHVLITIMASVGAGSAYAVRCFYNTAQSSAPELTPSRRTLLPCKGSTTTRTTPSAVCVRFFATLTCPLTPLFLDQWMVVMSTQLVGVSAARKSDLAIHAVNPSILDRLFHRRHCAPLPGAAAIHEYVRSPHFTARALRAHIPRVLSLAGKPGDMCAIQHAALAGVRGYG